MPNDKLQNSHWSVRSHVTSKQVTAHTKNGQFNVPDLRFLPSHAISVEYVKLAWDDKRY